MWFTNQDIVEMQIREDREDRDAYTYKMRRDEALAAETQDPGYRREVKDLDGWDYEQEARRFAAEAVRPTEVTVPKTSVRIELHRLAGGRWNVTVRPQEARDNHLFHARTFATEEQARNAANSAYRWVQSKI